MGLVGSSFAHCLKSLDRLEDTSVKVVVAVFSPASVAVAVYNAMNQSGRVIAWTKPPSASVWSVPS